MGTTLKPLGNIHHAAYRCRDAEQTRWFYEEVFGLKLAAAFEDTVDFGGIMGYHKRNFMHIFFEMADGNYVAFFDEPGASSPADFEQKDGFVLHLAFECENEAALLEWQKRINDMGVECLGPLDHDFVKSVYMFDPNGIQVEITCKPENGIQIMDDMTKIARDELKKWIDKTRPMKEEIYGADMLENRIK
jgi:catechol 2,3-dioxygenase-like lactoylglutathione lyase family enzyme